VPRRQHPSGSQGSTDCCGVRSLASGFEG
jgi:hypothetical protein